MLCAIFPITARAMDNDVFYTFKAREKNIPAFGANVNAHTVNHVFNPFFVSWVKITYFFLYDFFSLEIYPLHLEILPYTSLFEAHIYAVFGEGKQYA
jgi:hypothetical protein